MCPYIRTHNELEENNFANKKGAIAPFITFLIELLQQTT
jgi:hypothetical protein